MGTGSDSVRHGFLSCYRSLWKDGERISLVCCSHSTAVLQSELSWTARGGLDLRNEVYGTEGTIFTDITRETPIKVFSCPGAGYVVEKTDAETGWLFPPVDEAWIYGYAEEMQHFVDCVANNRTPRETFEDGYVVNCVLDAAYRSMQTKQWERVGY